MNRYVKYIKENLLIIVPAALVLITIIGFIIFGFAKPTTYLIVEEENIITSQATLEAAFMDDFKAGTYTKTNPFFVLNPYEIAPLSGLLIFEVNQIEDYVIIVRGNEEESNLEFQITSVYSEKLDTYLVYAPIYGLYENTLNTVEVYENLLGSKGEEISSVTFLTEALPKGVDTISTIDTTFEYFQNDIMILMPALGDKPVGYDYAGNVRWYLSENLTFAPQLLANGHLLVGTNRLMSDPYYVTGLYEIDYLGKVYKEYTIPGGYHHDVVELPNGNLLTLSSKFEGTVEDFVVEIDKTTGDIIKTWDLEKFIPKTQGPAQMWTSFDWFHNNSIDYDEATDSILLSGRHQDIVINISYTYNRINYIIGDPNNWPESYTSTHFLTPIGENFEWQYAQHSAIFTPNGIFIFDNGNNKSKDSSTYVGANNSYSRGVLYSINQDQTEITQVFEFGKEFGSSFYSPYISNVQYLGENQYMIHSGGHGRVGGDVLNVPSPLYEGSGEVILKSMTYEVLNNEIVYYLETNSNYYQALHTSLYTDKSKFIPGTGRSVGELAVTPQSDIVLDLDFNFYETVPPKYQLDFTKESDRLIVTGVFDPDDEIYLIMKNNSGELVYEIPTSNTAYTAMCIGTFFDDGREIIYYINETNLSGYYELYLVVNNVEYNTYQHVIFD